MTEKQLCMNCKHLEHDGMAGIWCGVHGNNENYNCPKFEYNWRMLTKKEAISLLKRLYRENEQLKQSIDDMGGRLQGLWANYYENRWGVWSEAVEDVAKELGFKIYTIYDVPISNSNAKKERINGVKKVYEVMGENEELKFDKQELHRALSREEVRHKQFRDKVFDLIDEKIKEADIRECDCCRNCVADQLLTELKKELIE